MGTVHFNYQKKTSLKDREKLKQFILSIFKKEKKKVGSINYVFCDDAYILQVNQQFLKHNYYTDIITFDLSEPGADLIDAEIYISVDTVKSNSKLFGTNMAVELHRVIFHGVLHLCGFGDKTQAEQKEMRRKENQYLKSYNDRFHE